MNHPIFILVAVQCSRIVPIFFKMLYDGVGYGLKKWLTLLTILIVSFSGSLTAAVR